MLCTVSTPSRTIFVSTDSPSSPPVFPRLPTSAIATAWSPDARSLAAATSDGSVYVWADASIPLGEPARLVKGSSKLGPVTALALDSSSGLTLLYSQGSKVHSVDVRSGAAGKTLEHFPSPITDFSLSSDGVVLVAGHKSGKVIVYNRQHDSHHILPLDLDGEAIARCRLHPSRKNILYILAESNPSVIVYDTLKPSRPSKVVDLGSRAGIPVDLAFHSGGTHVCVVTTAGSLVTLNTGTWTTRVRELKVPLAAVAWVGPTEVAVGTETGRLLIRSVHDEKSGRDLVVDENGDQIVSIFARPLLTGKASQPRATSKAGDGVLSDSTNRLDRGTKSSAGIKSGEKNQSRTEAARRLSVVRTAVITPDNLPTSSSRSQLHRSGSTAASSDVTSASIARSTHSRIAPPDSDTEATYTRPRPTSIDQLPKSVVSSATAARHSGPVRKVGWGDEDAGADDRTASNSPVGGISETTRARLGERRAESPVDSRPSSRSSSSTASPRPSSASRSPPSATSPLPASSFPDATSHPSGTSNDSSLLFALSQQIRDLHLDMIRARREAKLELRACFKDFSRQNEALRAENTRLKEEVERLRRGF